MKPNTHQPKQNGPRQKLSSYFSNEQVNQQLFGEETQMETLEVLNDEYETSTHKQISENLSQSNTSLFSNQRQNNRQKNNPILQHFYNPSEGSDNEESIPPPRHNKNQTQPIYPNTTHQKNQQSSKSKRPSHTSRQVQQPMEHQYPLYPNPYQFFPFYPPFFPPFSGITEESMKEQLKNSPNNDTFMTDKSVESSMVFEKDKNFDLLLAESREMRQIIQSQYVTIELILKKLEEVNSKVDCFINKEIFQHDNKQDHVLITKDLDEPQPRQPSLDVSNQFFTQIPCTSNRSSATSVPNMSASYKNLTSNISSPSKYFNRGQVNGSMANNTSLNSAKSQNSGTLEKTTNRSDTHSIRYSTASPTISNSPIRPSSNSQSASTNRSVSSKKSVQSQNSTTSTNSTRSQNFDENLVKSPLYFSSNLKDMNSPVKSTKSETKRKVTNNESFLNASHLSESMELLADTHGDDSFVYNASASYMSSYSTTPLEPFSTEMQKYVKEKILVGDVSKKDDIAKDSENTFVTGSKRNHTLSYSSSSFPIKSFSKI